MAKIEIKDLPKDYKISIEEMKRIKGGVLLSSTSFTLDYKIEGITGESTDEDHKKWIDG